MNHKLSLPSGLCAAALVMGSVGAAAQSGSTTRLHCHTVGSAAPEVLGDREGHAVSVSQHSCRVEGGLTDGKPSGMTGSGRGRYTLATGSAAALAGKTYSYTFSMTGPNQFVVEVKHD